MTETCDDRVMVKVDMEGNVLRFHILGYSTIKCEPMEIPLSPGKPQTHELA